MNDREKMINGLLYDAFGEESLVKDRTVCKLLCQEYNNIAYDNFEKRTELIKKIVKKTGKKFLIEQPFQCDYGYNIEIGENFYANHNLIILDCAKVKFGNNVFIAPNCAFYTPQHPLDVETRNKGLEYAFPITIGDNVWIGGNVVVLAGVKIGNNSVIGAGSVVTKDIPNDVVAVGNP
ncbi:MAG: sugar O-acetyltransferase, partial [Floccifex sp.]